MADFTEEFIEHVKKHDVLFDMAHRDYKNVRIKNKVWDDIAKDMGNHHTGDDLKNRWKNLKDCFSKHLRSEKTRTGQAAKSISRYKAWPWAQHMESFRPFLQFAVTDSNIADTNIGVSEEIEASDVQNEATQMTENILSEASTDQETSKQISCHNRRPEKKRKSMELPAPKNSSSADKVIKYLNERHSDIKSNCNSIDLTFQGYAASVKRLSNRRQTVIKFKIAKLIMEEELAQEAEAQEQSRPGTSYSRASASSSYEMDLRSPFDNESSYHELSNPSNLPGSSNDLNFSGATWYEDLCKTTI
ncbi:uncharacterized protein LOC126742654 [Anthonomus grandis grandis]|uniref:uncharacterized protein LOC126742654 n=1 Tax=Anthonomus grandis grandis TaxID=2921223 RepID=UPI00216617B6|nr:uncharacterized protein LOC126742654 [Anthonomus grandis grandis]